MSINYSDVTLPQHLMIFDSIITIHGCVDYTLVFTQVISSELLGMMIRSKPGQLPGRACRCEAPPMAISVHQLVQKNSGRCIPLGELIDVRAYRSSSVWMPSPSPKTIVVFSLFPE
jgi:hypothetical protein